MTKISFISLGCSKNQVDSEKLLGVLLDKFELTNNYREAEYIFINTCAFIESAKKEAIDTIFEMSQYKEIGKCKKLIVFGCFSQRYGELVAPDLPEVDRFVTIDEYESLNSILTDLLNVDFKGDYHRDRILINKPYSAYLKIAEGCDNRCSYCAIPLIRGKYRSYPKEELITEAKRLAGLGVKEIVLIAQDTTLYGQDLYGYLALGELLEEINKIDGIVWIRVLYMYPDLLDEKLIKTMNRLDKVLMYFDIPMQYGSNRMLTLMNRRGTVEKIESVINYLKSLNIDHVLRTTLMVGFPGETEDDFNRMIEFVKRNKFHKLGAFIFSKEEDTAAFDMEPIIKADDSGRRYDVLMSTQMEISRVFNQSLVGKVFETLIEQKVNGGYLGRCLYQSPDGIDGSFYIDNSKELIVGEIVEIEVVKSNDYDIYGKAI